MKQRANHEAIAALVADITRAMVDRPEHVSINVVRETTVTMLEVSVAAGDIGKLVGRDGRSAVALRILLFNLGTKSGRRFVLELVDPIDKVG